VILDTKGNIFGCLTLVTWEPLPLADDLDDMFGDKESPQSSDDSLKSFLFTLKNQRNIPARRFALKADQKHQAIYYDSDWGPCFGSDDIFVADACNTKPSSCTFLGRAYTNNTGLSSDIVFTDSNYFQVKEIEIFEITD
jgi:hypothetical protein